MHLTALQHYTIEKALIKGDSREAERIYREATSCSEAQAVQAVAAIDAELRETKPWHFKTGPAVHSNASSAVVKTGGISMRAVAAFLLFDALLVVGLVYYFVFRDAVESDNSASVGAAEALRAKAKSEASQAPVPAAELPRASTTASRKVELAAGESFHSLYRDKLADRAYIARRNQGLTSFDDGLPERKIKAARSELAERRSPPSTAAITPIVSSTQAPSIDGVLGEGEWQDATRLLVDAALGTTLYLKVDGEWLYVACDVPKETTSGGYDQFRLYLHAGLVEGLVNERIHVARSRRLTSIRQTTFRWQGRAPASDNERWKRYPINDWGLYEHAVGTSSMAAGHRQYEAAVHLGEAGLHKGVPFTLYVEVETDPLRDANNKFVERRYLGFLGSESSPEWMMF